MTAEDKGVQRFSGWGIAMMRQKPKTEYVLATDYDRLATELSAARTLLEEWMLASDNFDIESWAKRVRDMLEDSNPFNGSADTRSREP